MGDSRWVVDDPCPPVTDAIITSGGRSPDDFSTTGGRCAELGGEEAESSPSVVAAVADALLAFGIRGLARRVTSSVRFVGCSLGFANSCEEKRGGSFDSLPDPSVGDS